jgi:hypothetical protein
VKAFLSFELGNEFVFFFVNLYYIINVFFKKKKIQNGFF